MNAIDRHFALVDALRSEKDKQRQKTICIDDIAIVDDFNREWISKAEREAENLNLKGAERKKYISLPLSYPSFKKLAVIYEKEGKYKEAIEVCRKAIKAGYKKDGTVGGMSARITKLKEKIKKEAAK